MSTDQTLARTLHDLGAAAWFGGALMGPVALPSAARAPVTARGEVEARGQGWQAWQPWKAAAIGAHVVGSLGLLWGNKGRLTGQRGAMRVNLIKTGVFAAAVGADVAAAKLGERYAQEQADEGSTSDGTPGMLRAAQWTTAALTGVNVALGAKMGEQQRPGSVLAGVAERLDPRH